METFEVGLVHFLHYEKVTSLWGQGVECSGLNVNGPHKFMIEYLVPSWWNVLE